jgi:hypothetical protein
VSTSSIELKKFNKMRKTFRRLTVIASITSVLTAGLSAYMFYLATPPINSDYATYEKWITDHQEQLLAEQAGRFYWTEGHSGLLLGGTAVLLLAAAVLSVQILIVAKVAKITAKAVIAEERND